MMIGQLGWEKTDLTGLENMWQLCCIAIAKLPTAWVSPTCNNTYRMFSSNPHELASKYKNSDFRHARQDIKHNSIINKNAFSKNTTIIPKAYCLCKFNKEDISNLLQG